LLSGTTWVSELVWLVMNNCDAEKAAATPLYARTSGIFYDSGKTGDRKNHFSPELNSRIDEWIEKNLAVTDLKFVTELEHQDLINYLNRLTLYF
jgi:hypothetical protein